MAEAPEPPRRNASYFAGAMGIIALIGACHVALANLLLAPVFAADPGELGPHRRIATAAIVISVLAQMATGYLRAARGSPDQVTSSVVWVARTAPAVTTVALLLLLPPGTSPRTFVIDEELAIPLLATTWATGLMLAIPQKRVLHAIAIRIRSALPGMIRIVDTAGLGGSYGRTLAGIVAAMSILVGAATFTRMDEAARIHAGSSVIAAMASLIAFAVICAIAGWSLGQSPGRDVLSIARRLDALGYNARYGGDSPVVVTSFDDLGLLFRRIEDLRTHLAAEVRLYQDALDRTRVADAAKAEFLAAVSHELRTPLNSICGFAQLLLDDAASPLTESQAEDVRLIRTGGHQLLALLNDILDISMIESGELSLRFAPTDIGDLAGEVVDIHRPLTRDRPLEIRVEIDPELPKVNCDRRRIGQVLTNLVSNAIKFTERGEIVVSARHLANDDCVALTVRDTGIGISPEDLPTIFDEYRQVGSLKRRAKGTGLGLAIARSIAIHHGGSLSVESRVDEGSVFTLDLPIQPRHQPDMIDMTEERVRAIQRSIGKSKTLVPFSRGSEIAIVAPAGEGDKVPGGGA